MKSCSAPDGINTRLYEMHHLLERFTVCGKKTEVEMRVAGDKVWTDVPSKK